MENWFDVLTDEERTALYDMLFHAWWDDSRSPVGIELDGLLYDLETHGTA